MGWTYMSDGLDGTAISDRPTTIAPLKAVLKSICRIEASNLLESSSRLWSAGSASKQISCVETVIPGDNVKPGIDWSKPDFAIDLVDHHLSLSILTIKLCWKIVAVKQPNSTWWSVAWFSGRSLCWVDKTAFQISTGWLHVLQRRPARSTSGSFVGSSCRPIPRFWWGTVFCWQTYSIPFIPSHQFHYNINYIDSIPTVETNHDYLPVLLSRCWACLLQWEPQIQ